MKRTINYLIPFTISIILFSSCAAPKIFVGSRELNFKDAEIGESVSKDIVIENQGSGNLKISKVSISGDMYSQMDPEEDIIIYPRQKHVVKVQFLPNESGKYSGVMSIHSNDPKSMILTIPLEGKGVIPKNPEIKVVSSVDFSNVPKDSVARKTLTISNNGEAVLMISDLVLIGDGFKLPGLFSKQTTIYQRQSVDLTIEFAPVKTGSFSGLLSVYSNDIKNKIAVVSLKGEGVEKQVPRSVDKVARQGFQNQNKTEENVSNVPVERDNINGDHSSASRFKKTNLGVFTHDDKKGTMKTMEGTMQKNEKIAYSFEVQKTGDFEILVTPGYELISDQFTLKDVSTFSDKSRYIRFVREKVSPNSSFEVVIKRKENSPDKFTFIFKLFPR